MKKFIALALVTFGISVSARAQLIVFDPTMNVQSIINTAQEIAKYVEMITRIRKSPAAPIKTGFPGTFCPFIATPPR